MVVIFHRGRQTPDTAPADNAPAYHVRGAEMCFRNGQMVFGCLETGESFEIEQCEGAFIVGDWFYLDVDFVEESLWHNDDPPTIDFHEFEKLFL